MDGVIVIRNGLSDGLHVIAGGDKSPIDGLGQAKADARAASSTN